MNQRMDIDEALLLLDRLCEDDQDSVNQIYEAVEPVISLPSDISLDTNNNSFNLSEINGIFSGIDEESITDKEDTDTDQGDTDDPDFDAATELDESTDDRELIEETQNDGTVSKVVHEGKKHGTKHKSTRLNTGETRSNERDTAESSCDESQSTEEETTDTNREVDESDIGTTTEDLNDENDTDYEDNERYSRSRKRKRNESDWKKNVRKRKRQSGLEYHDALGRKQRKREVKTKKDCQGKCKFHCSTNITSDERQALFTEFWNLTDTEKYAFYAKTSERLIKERNRSKAEKSRRQYSYRYFFVKGDETVRVCKEFYLSTLDISQRRVEYFHERKAATNEFTDKRGKHTKSKVPTDTKEFIKEHINSFPRMSSHYCRATTRKEYLAADLNMTRMYNLYVEKCTENDIVPVKSHYYRHIFNTEFNIGFHMPKKDRCDLCMEYEAQSSNNKLTRSLQDKYETHKKDKTETKTERDNDRKTNVETEAVICFDLQNVLTCPRANVSSFFYRRKLNVYNLTAHCSLDKKAYNAIWPECTAGRGANEIASALSVILKTVLEDHPSVTSFILWSDSCVPQNRNSIMTLALKTFMKNHTNIQKIEQKYCTPGHSSIQEVDNIHSHLEKGLKVAEVYSPVSLLRVMTNIRPRLSRYIQLTRDQFYNFQNAAAQLKFSTVPYSKVKHLQYSRKKKFHVNFKMCFADAVFTEVSIRGQTTRHKHANVKLPVPKPIPRRPILSKEKKADFQAMLRFMPEQDREFYVAACKIVDVNKET